MPDVVIDDKPHYTQMKSQILVQFIKGVRHLIMGDLITGCYIVTRNVVGSKHVSEEADEVDIMQLFLTK